MRIITDESRVPGEELLEKMTRAAEIVLQQEGICPFNCEVSLTIADPEEIRALNNKYRGRDNATDVLSFPMYDSPGEIREAARGALDSDAARTETTAPAILLGDVVICEEVARKQAAEIGQSLERELLYLFIHSMLHLLGHDHESSEEKNIMREAEKDILQQLEQEV